MKYRVKIEGQSFDVVIDDIQKRPVIARVDGEAFEVWVDDTPTDAPVASGFQSGAAGGHDQARPAKPGSDAATNANHKQVLAPIPGVIVAVSVKTGDQVAVGQELCVLEAMKMKNVIRSPRTGEIAVVNAAIGQTVQHHHPLIEFTE